tara:strand:+ start:2149 stop:3066 length:918 start_codon:yes stop_codon:yes gene_type:complete
LERLNNIRSILVTGGSGQVGSDLKDVSSNHKLNYHFPSSKVFNITKENTIRKYLDKNKINLILNLAAYTNVEKAEKEKIICDNVNFFGATLISKIAKEYEIGIIHFSTDYVFGQSPHKIRNINDDVSPINYYGLSKSKGEKGILDNNELGFIIRVASVYSKYGKNFVKSMIKLLLNEKEVRIVSDQKISICSSRDLADNIPYLIEIYKKNIIHYKNKSGDRILHFTNKGYTTWLKVAKVIKDEINNTYKDRSTAKIIPILNSEWKSQAKRPMDSRLKVDFRSFEREDINLPSWETSIRSVVRDIL